MKRKWNGLAIALGVVSVASIGACNAASSDYPTRPIRLVIPFSSGGGTDTLARLIAARMTETWGRQTVVDSRPGGNGVIGMEIVARANPDGHTLVLAYIANLGTAPAMNRKLPYDAKRDFAPISHIVNAPSIVVLHPGVQAKSFQDLILQNRGKPGVAFGTAGVGSIGHLVGEMVNRAAGVSFQHIAYKGGGQGVVDVLSGHIPMAILGMAPVAAHIRAGRLRAVAVTGGTRSAAFADVPTIAEQGFPGIVAEAWYGFAAPAGTPRAIIAKVHGEVTRIIALPEVRERLANLGFEPVGSTPEQFADLIAKEIVRWTQVIRDAGIASE